MRLNDVTTALTSQRCVTASLLLAASVLTACGGNENKGATTDTAAARAVAPAAGAAAGSTTAVPSATSTGAAAPITGKTVDVRMIGDTKGYRFEPATFTVKVGDGARFTNVSGGPHNVTFWSDSIPAGTATQLGNNMPSTMGPLTGPLLTAPNQTYVVSFAGLKPGVYHFYCTPHLALGMRGVITIK